MKKEERQETECFSDSKSVDGLNTVSKHGCRDIKYTDTYQVPNSVKQLYFKLQYLHSKIIIIIITIKHYFKCNNNNNNKIFQNVFL